MTMKSLFLLIFLSGVRVTESFMGLYSSSSQPPSSQRKPSCFSSSSSSSTEEVTSKTSLLEEIRSMSVRDLKKELTALQKPTNDAFEKETLVQRLLEARMDRQQRESSTATSASKNHAAGQSSTSTNTRDDEDDAAVLQVPLYLTYLDQEMKVAAVNMPNGGGGGITIEPTSDQPPFASIQITIQNDQKLTLLLDTACSGFVLRPEVVQRYNLPSYSTPVTMTGAGGTAGNTGLTQLDSFSLGDDNDKGKKKFGPLPAAVQDIGALPRQLDGIIGLSFLSQFQCFEMDFHQGVVRFFPLGDDGNGKSPPPPPPPPSSHHENKHMSVIAQADMRLVSSLGIYTTKVFLGGRGPVDLLVDSGASSTLLSWKGVSDLGLSRDSNHVQRIPGLMGAMGSDNVAIELTHRLNVSSRLQLGSSSSSNNNNLNNNLPGISLAGKSRLPIDVGSVPILTSLESQGVGGILGVDVLMRCAVVRISCRGGSGAEITMFDDDHKNDSQ